MRGGWLGSIVVAGLLCNEAGAHDTWLLQADVDASGLSGETGLLLTSGMAFPTPDFAIDPKRIAEQGCRVDGVRCELAIGKRGAHALVLSAGVPRSLPAVVWIDLAPKTLTLSEAKVREYFVEIDASADIRAAWDARRKPRRWRETYVKHAKSLIGIRADAGVAWSAPVGSALEIVPTSEATFEQGRDVQFEVLAQGHPLPDFPIGAVSGPDAKAIFLHTDARGRVRVPIDRCGDWLLRVTRLTPSSKSPLDWNSDFATLSFVVR